MNRSGSDFVCLQEIKAQSCDITPSVATPDGYLGYFECAEKKGYSGTGIYTKIMPDKVGNGFGSKEFDAEGRYLQCDFKDFSVCAFRLFFTGTTGSQIPLHG